MLKIRKTDNFEELYRYQMGFSSPHFFPQTLERGRNPLPTMWTGKAGLCLKN